MDIYFRTDDGDLVPKLAPTVSDAAVVPPDREKIRALSVTGKVPTWVFDLPNLEELRLQDIKKVPPQIGSLRGLKRLLVSGAREVPEEIGDLQSLQVLRFSDHKIKTLPPGVGALKSLVFLELQADNPALAAPLPDALEGLESLEVLSLECAKLEELPSFIKRWPLRHLVLSECSRIKTLPATIAECPLESLVIYECKKFRALPEATWSLTHLWLEGTFKAVPDGYWSPALEDLRMAYVKVRDIPDALAAATRLRRLEFIRCGIRKVPAWFGQLSQLERISFSENYALKHVPGLERMSALKVLHLDETEVESTTVREVLGEREMYELRLPA